MGGGACCPGGTLWPKPRASVKAVSAGGVGDGLGEGRGEDDDEDGVEDGVEDVGVVVEVVPGGEEAGGFGSSPGEGTGTSDQTNIILKRIDCPHLHH